MGSISLEMPAVGGRRGPFEVRRLPVTAEPVAQRSVRVAGSAAPDMEAAEVEASAAQVMGGPALTPASGVAAAAVRRWEMEERALINEESRNRYQVVRLLGRGQSGAVYLGREVALHRLVVVKVLRPEAGAEAHEHFRREARLGAQLAHRGIVPVFGFEEHARLAYLVMQYVPGTTLAERMRERGRIHHEEVRRILSDMVLALVHAHGNGVVHRDLKPDNVLLERDTGRAILADFGVAMRHWSDREIARERRAWGTPAYMSPEQALGEPDVDGRSDLYAVGLIGFAMLTGRLPFNGNTPASLLASRLTAGSPRVRQYTPSTPSDLARVIDRCLEMHREKRWSSAGELLRALRERKRWLRRVWG